MEIFYNLLKAILVILSIFALALVMRRRGMLAEDHSVVLARIVTDICLPAIVFVTLARQNIKLSELTPAFLMLFTEIICICLAWLIAVWAGFDRAKQGAIVFCSAFGSSTFLGYSIIIHMFPETPQALTEAVLISEIGVGYPIFIFGPVLASYFGSEESDLKSAWSYSLQFFKSPVFYALLFGFLWGYFRLPREEHPVFAPLFQLCNVLASALIPIAIISVGLMFRMPKLKTILIPLAIVISIKLIFKPVFIGIFATTLGFPKLWRDVLIVLSSMPSAILGAVFLKRHGGDGELASTLILGASIVSIITVHFVFRFFG